MDSNNAASLCPALTSPSSLHETEHAGKVEETCEQYLRTIITIQAALHEEKLRHEHEQAKISAHLASLFNLIQASRSNIDSENTQNKTLRTSSPLPKPDTTGGQGEVIEIDDRATTSAGSTTVESENQSLTRSLQDTTSREQPELSDGSVPSLSPERSTSPNDHEQHDEESTGQEESTVELLKVKKTAPIRSGPLPYSPAEDEFIGRAAQRLLAEGFTRTETFRQIAELEDARGYKRTPAALMVRWYTKVLKKHPIQPTQQTTELGNEGRSSATTREKPLKSKASIKVPVSSRKIPANDKHPVRSPLKSTPTPEIKGDSPIRSIHAILASNRQSRVLDVRLGDGIRARRFGRLGISELQKATGQHFIIERTWTGASSDILDLAWSPDGSKFVAGSAALEHPSNRANNLLFGDMLQGQLRGLLGHRQSHASTLINPGFTDPWTYCTVGSVCWRGDSFYTAGYDGTVKVWDSTIHDAARYTLPHQSPIQVMAVSNTQATLLATGTDSGDQSIRLYHDVTTEGYRYQVLLPVLRNNKLPFTYSPTCMKFGITPHYSNHLLVGFGSNLIFEDGSPSPRGFLGLWRFDEGGINRLSLNPAGQQVFDVAWSEQSNIFITGTTTGKRASGVASSLVRVYDGSRTDSVLEAACPAMDINDVSICPFDERFVSASCTNGKAYLWDTRNFASPLHVLSHGPNVSGHNTEVTDTGVRVFEWGNDRSELFTGSSDGTLRQWDMRQGTADVFTEEVTKSGIELMCGKLSPEKTSFVLGDASGSLQILARSPVRATELPEDMDFVYSPENLPSRHSVQTGVTEEGWGGREAARELLETERIVAYPGNYVGQGPNYEGPFAAWARPPTEENLRDVPLLPEVEAMQRPRSSEGATVATKRKQSNIESERPSKKFKFKISTNPGTELLSTVMNKKRTPSRSVQSSARKGLSSSAAASDPVEINSDEDFRGSQALDVASEAEDEDDGYIPPHWMVDANLVKSVPELCQSEMGDNDTSTPAE